MIADARTGVCGVRRNSGGKLFTEIYGQCTALAMDPIEKKPLYHFFPGSKILSIGTRGCNLKCPYCQNWHISQDLSADTSYYTPESIVKIARERGSVGIAFTYSEPVIWFEYVMDTAKLARESGLKNVLVTNGFINIPPLDELLTQIDAMNIDLKAFKDETYKKVQKAKLSPVLKAIEHAYRKGCHVEITTLVVTGLNDDIEEMRGIVDFIHSLDRNIPWHISRYYPNYQYDEPPTDIDFMFRVCEEASKKLNFVYCGNVPSGNRGNNTICPSCGSTSVSRVGFFSKIERLKQGKCTKCGTDLNIQM